MNNQSTACRLSSQEPRLNGRFTLSCVAELEQLRFEPRLTLKILEASSEMIRYECKEKIEKGCHEDVIGDEPTLKRVDNVANATACRDVCQSLSGCTMSAFRSLDGRCNLHKGQNCPLEDNVDWHSFTECKKKVIGNKNQLIDDYFYQGWKASDAAKQHVTVETTMQSLVDRVQVTWDGAQGLRLSYRDSEDSEWTDVGALQNFVSRCDEIETPATQSGQVCRATVPLFWAEVRQIKLHTQNGGSEMTVYEIQAFGEPAPDLNPVEEWHDMGFLPANEGAGVNAPQKWSVSANKGLSCMQHCMQAEHATAAADCSYAGCYCKKKGLIHEAEDKRKGVDHCTMWAKNMQLSLKAIHDDPDGANAVRAGDRQTGTAWISDGGSWSVELTDKFSVDEVRLQFPTSPVVWEKLWASNQKCKIPDTSRFYHSYSKSEEDCKSKCGSASVCYVQYFLGGGWCNVGRSCPSTHPDGKWTINTYRRIAEWDVTNSSVCDGTSLCPDNNALALGEGGSRVLVWLLLF